MRVLIVASTYTEIAPFVEAHPEVSYLITGVGTSAVVYHVTRSLMQQRADCVVQAGIAGAAQGYVPDASGVVVVERDAFAQSGVWEDGILFNLQEKGLSSHDPWLKNPHNQLHTFGFPVADAVTVDLINNHPALLWCVSEKYGAQIESMEGAALHYVCLNEQVPFIQLRAISNTIGERDKSKWNLDSAITNLNIALEQLYHTLTKQHA